MNGKMIFMLFSIMWGRIQEQTTNFEHLVHETWPRTCGRVVFKLYKKQTKSENHETCQDVMISYVEAVIKIWEGFAQVVTYDACKPKNLRRSLPQVRGHVSWTRCSKLVVCSWIRPHIILNNINIIFPLIFFHYSND